MNLNKKDIQAKFPKLEKGMKVYTRDDEKLGKIDMLGDDFFQVEKGIFFPKEFSLRYDEIAEVIGDTVRLNHRAADLTEWQAESYPGWKQVSDDNQGTGASVGTRTSETLRAGAATIGTAASTTLGAGSAAVGRTSATPAAPAKDIGTRAKETKEDVRLSVMEEELHADKTRHQTGEVTIRKIVHTELRHLTVPVYKEEVRVERTPATGARTEVTDVGGAFQEKTVSIPIMEEEVTVSKRPVIREEVHVYKEQRTEQRDFDEQVRKEDVVIEGETKPKGTERKPDKPGWSNR